MKTFSTVFFSVLVSVFANTQAKADGFVCKSSSGLTLRAYNHTHPELGTRNAAILIISDSKISEGNKTIASFSDAKGTLQNNALVYTAKVDLRVKESNRKGELIAGTKLGYLESVSLYLNFTYAEPVNAGASVYGLLSLKKRNGETIIDEVNCLRYLKGE